MSTGKEPKPVPAFTRNWWLLTVLMANGFRLGEVRRFPGTLGSIAICPVIWLVANHTTPDTYLLIGILAFCYGLYACMIGSFYYQRGDPPEIIWDEFVGMWLALVYLPPEPAVIALAFVLFRIADICKPPPVAWADKSVPGPLGIMLDDVLAGLMANLAVVALMWLFW